MCGNDKDKPPPEHKDPNQIQRVGEADYQYRQGNTEAGNAAGGIAGDEARSNVRDAMKYVREYNSPLAALGIFARQNIDPKGAGKLKTTASSANPFYATMAASNEAAAKAPKGTGVQPTMTAGTMFMPPMGIGTGG